MQTDNPENDAAREPKEKSVSEAWHRLSDFGAKRNMSQAMSRLTDAG
jgi:hypothetical protein